MSSLPLAVRDSSTMLRRNLLHARRYPSLTLNLLLTPIMLLLLFVYVFGDVMSAGIGGGPADRSDYVAYLVPGLLLMTIGSTTIGTAVSVSNDMTEGIIARFRTMAIHRGSVIIGHVAGSVLQSIASVVLVGAVAVAIGFRSTDATLLEWLAAFGLVTLFALGLTCIAVGMGLVSPSAEAASNNALPLILLPLLSSAFIPVDTMPGWFQPIAEYQPFTPAIETLRGPAARHRDRQQRVARHRLVRGSHGARLRLVDLDVQPRPRHPHVGVSAHDTLDDGHVVVLGAGCSPPGAGRATRRPPPTGSGCEPDAAVGCHGRTGCLDVWDERSSMERRRR